MGGQPTRCRHQAGGPLDFEIYRLSSASQGGVLISLRRF